MFKLRELFKPAFVLFPQKPIKKRGYQTANKVSTKGY
jgi:hypothetical protein